MEHVDVTVIGGSQAGLAAAHALAGQGRTPVVLEASNHMAGSRPHYYDSLPLLSPARSSALPGMAFGGDPDRCLHRDEVVTYPTAYAARLQADIRTRQQVTAVPGGRARFHQRVAVVGTRNSAV
ncbi:NAD(P)-binding protein [Streptomyces sp. NPDC048507]|uniref:NAD(P)-binding protein n=1 Tax=Streptomyces sp. NPDC048507 TaxID=3365560 RepID=UPI0037153BB8